MLKPELNLNIKKFLVLTAFVKERLLAYDKKSAISTTFVLI